MGTGSGTYKFGFPCLVSVHEDLRFVHIDPEMGPRISIPKTSNLTKLMNISSLLYIETLKITRMFFSV
jgi:hypothetical protein